MLIPISRLESTPPFKLLFRILPVKDRSLKQYSGKMFRKYTIEERAVRKRLRTKAKDSSLVGTAEVALILVMED